MNRILFNVRWQSTLLAASITHQAAYKNGESDNSENDDRFSSAVASSSRMVLRKMEEVGAPGMVVAVSINGKTVWSQGFGRSDVENNVKCHSGTKMRVASISKCFTAVAMAKLCEDGVLDVDKPIHDYLPDYPPMKYDNKEVKVTLRQLLSHVAGVRHYSKEDDPKTSDFKADQSEKLSTKHYPSVTKALEMFKNDALVNNPEDNSFLYTTHGYTLVSAVMEKATGKNFLRLMKDLFLLIGMDDTVPDLNDRIIYDRSRCYQRKNGKLLNSPYVDLSYKWAGGGFISTVGDILKFGNA
uniref:Beta-lactamase-related domain-containing protein n=1 Tax=Ciona savignyi TaxID=51511 RepID=H2ZK75_CIOSA